MNTIPPEIAEKKALIDLMLALTKLIDESANFIRQMTNEKNAPAQSHSRNPHTGKWDDNF